MIAEVPDNGGPIYFSVLGPLRVTRGGEELDLGPRQQRLMLALLLVEAGGLVTMDQFVELLWPGDAPSTAVNMVQRYVGALRRILEPDLESRANGHYLLRQIGGYRILVTEHTLDLIAFRRDAGSARAALDQGDFGGAISRSQDALGSWRGRCGAGLEPTSLEHSVFAAIEAEYLQAVRVAADAAAAGGDMATVLMPLLRAAEQHPLDEGLQSRLLLALAATGQHAEALERYREIRTRLADELGVDPGVELREAYQMLLHQEVVPSRPVRAAPVLSSAVAVPRPAQLPPDLPCFVGRQDVLNQARAIAERPNGGVLAIAGMPGIGKTAVSVHVAHVLADHYPDGQLYADLRGFDEHAPAMSPAEALRGFLGSLGVPQDQVPHELHAQAGLFRSTLSGRRLLIVLDNCRDAEQVRHLLPGSPGCLVIANSRNRLTGLIAGAGAYPLTLGPPTLEEARHGMRLILGRRAEAEPEIIDQIIEACGRLPLALAVVSANAVSRPQTPLPEIAAELKPARTQGDLHGFDGADTRSNLRAVFSWSYRALSAPAASLFRLLPLLPGPDFSADAAAATAGMSMRECRTALGELEAAHLVLRSRTHRFHLHDLIKAYAAEVAAVDDPPGCAAAKSRCLRFYYDTAVVGRGLLIGIDQPSTDLDQLAHATLLDHADRDAARDWFDAEREALAALVGSTARDRPHTSWRLALVIQKYLERSGRSLDWAAIARVGLDAATRAGDVYGRAGMHRSLAGALYFLREFDEAVRHLDEAREILAPFGRTAESARLSINLGQVLHERGDHHRVLAVLAVTAAEAQRANDLKTLADALSICASSWVELGRYDEAMSFAERALRNFCLTRDDQGAGDVWRTIGLIYAATGDPVAAVQAWREAAAHFQRAGADPLAAEALTWIGDVLAESDDRPAAEQAWKEAVELTAESQTAMSQMLRLRLLPQAQESGAIRPYVSRKVPADLGHRR